MLVLFAQLASQFHMNPTRLKDKKTSAPIGLSRPVLRFSLAQKSFLLLLLPAVLQLVLLVGLICLQLETHMYVGRATQDKQLTDCYLKYFCSNFALQHNIFAALQQAKKPDRAADQWAVILLQSSKSLDSALKQFAERRQRLLVFADQAKTTELEQQMKITRAVLDAQTAASLAALRDSTPTSYRVARDTSINILEQERGHARPFQQTAAERHDWATLLIAGAAADLLLLLLLAAFFVRGIICRLATIIDNNRRFSQGQPLRPRLRGSDEIYALDRSFHDMADSLKQQAQARNAIVENAQDMVCSIDEHGRLVHVSRRSVELLGYESSALENRYLLDLIPPSEQEQILNTLRSLRTAAEPLRFETQLVRQDDKLVDVLWSASWSAEEKASFCVVHDISQRTAADRLQQEIIQMVSHDLRTLLSGLSNFHQLLAIGRFGKLGDLGLRGLALAERSNNRMLELVNDLLEMEKVEAGGLQLDISQISVSDLFDQSAQAVLPIANSAGVTLHVMPSTSFITGDERRLVQVLVNLLSNAIKFTPAGKAITLSADDRGTDIEIQVKDEGRGIPPPLIGKIFDPFFQVEAADGKSKGGSGLGLSICKGLIKLHGGHIGVFSQPNHGSTFWIRLPKAQTSLASSVHAASGEADKLQRDKRA